MNNLNSGIYVIENLVNGKEYVGSSVNLKLRIGTHLNELRKNAHANAKLQRAWNKYGEDQFEFKVLEYIEPVKQVLLAREQYWIDGLDVVQQGYNISPTAGSSLGSKLSDVTRAKMRLAAVGKIQPPTSDETKAKQSISALNRAPVSEVTRQKIRDLHTGAKRSDAMKAKMRGIALARPPVSEATKNKIRATADLRVQPTMNMSEWHINFIKQHPELS